MSLYQGSLIGSMTEYLRGHSNRRFGLLIIDEQAEGDADATLAINMIRVIAWVQAYGGQVVLVEINPAMTAAARRPTRQELYAMLPDDTPVFFKRGFNAFGVIDDSGRGKAVSSAPPTGYADISLLDGVLRSAGVNELIVMGRQGSQCVKRTVIGGIETSSGVGPELKGALDYGYQVWTTPDIVVPRGEVFLWYAKRGIRCYETI
jgi:nicotinamidase-related amidase